MNNVTPHTAFTPAKEVQDIDRFAGRKKQLDAISSALQSDGAQIVLYGQRGVGKSSLARILYKMSINDSVVLDRLQEKPYEYFDYFPIYISCDDSIFNIERLLIRLLVDESALANWLPYKVIEKETIKEGGATLSVKILELSGKGSQSITERMTEVEADTYTTFINSCKSIIRSGVSKDGILLIIDEFDRVKNKDGVSSLLKTLGPEGVTFAFVGVANTLNELIADHESVARQLSEGAIKVEPMDEPELGEIIERAMESLDNKYSFSRDAISLVSKIARGHPYYVQLIGKHALLHSITNRKIVVDVEDVRVGIEDIALKGSAPIQENLYKTAIGHSYIREYVLKEFAKKQEDEIHTTELYADIARNLSIDPAAVSVYVGHLASEKYGSVLAKSRDRYYSFIDSLFKAYSALRPYELKPGDKEDAS